MISNPIYCKVCGTVFTCAFEKPTDVLEEMESKGWKACGTRGNFCPLHSNGQTFSQAVIRDETIDHPAHYGGDTIYEAIKVIEAWQLGFNTGNAVKYIARHQHKGDPISDLKKAKWYIDREIQRLEKKQ